MCKLGWKMHQGNADIPFHGLPGLFVKEAFEENFDIPWQIFLRDPSFGYYIEPSFFGLMDICFLQDQYSCNKATDQDRQWAKNMEEVL